MLFCFGAPTDAAVPPPHEARRVAGLSARLVSRWTGVIFLYPVPHLDAERIARSADSTLAEWRKIAARHSPASDPPFVYSVLVAEARRLANAKEAPGDAK